MFQVNPLLGKKKIKPYFLRKIKVKLKCRLLQFFGALRIKLYAVASLDEAILTETTMYILVEQ